MASVIKRLLDMEDDAFREHENCSGSGCQSRLFMVCIPATRNVRGRSLGVSQSEPPVLTVRPVQVYAHPVAFNSAAGFGDPRNRGEQPPCGYFCSQRSRASMISMAGRVGRPSGLPVPLLPVRQPRFGLPPRLATAMAGLQFVTEEPCHG